MGRGFLGRGGGGGTVPVPWGHLAPSPRAGSLIKTAARAVAQLVPPASTRSGKHPPLAAPINGNLEPPRPGGVPSPRCPPVPPGAPRCHLPGTLQPGWHRPLRVPASAPRWWQCHRSAQPGLSTPRFWGRSSHVPAATPGLWQWDRRGDATLTPQRAPGWGQGPGVAAVAAGTGPGTAARAGTLPSPLPPAQLSQGAGGAVPARFHLPFNWMYF